MSDKDKTTRITKGYPPSRTPPPGRRDAGAPTPKTPKPPPKKG